MKYICSYAKHNLTNFCLHILLHFIMQTGIYFWNVTYQGHTELCTDAAHRRWCTDAEGSLAIIPVWQKSQVKSSVFDTQRSKTQH